MKKSNRFKVILAMSFAALFAALGDISLSKGMKGCGDCVHSAQFPTIADIVTNGYVLGGVTLLFVFLVLYLISLSWEDLSYVLSLTGAIYILVTIFAFVLLHEHVSAMRWAGSFLVACGIVVVART
jgi:drug/metabolite transporter (DMT)-like permease